MSPTDPGSLGGNSVANAINESAQIAGSSVVTGTTRHAFLYSDGVMADLGTLGGASSEALAINERGEVVGSSQTSSGATRAFVWRDGVMTDLNTFLPSGSGWVLRSATAISDGGQIVGTGTHNGITRGFILTPQTDLELFIGGVRSLSDSNLPRGIEVGKQVFWVTSLRVGRTTGHHSVWRDDDAYTHRPCRVRGSATRPAEIRATSRRQW